ncbi:MAG: hypothetical protein M1825_002524 [Sarcosagium campestre]|nr:MAG: hypothetical protein M1825_002524 [Sarcosagium campestre]
MEHPEDVERRERARQRREENTHNRFTVYSPPEAQKLSAFTVVCLILNRTIGSGIFIVPAIALNGTGSVGVALCFWPLATLISICGVLCWLEFGLTIPKLEVDGVAGRVSVPRSGGEKNYLEYIYSQPRYLATCLYGVLFILYGNLAGNAIALGTYAMRAAGYEDGAAVRGIAVSALTLACILHMVWRKGGIIVNNMFAVGKVIILLVIIVLGLAAIGGAKFGQKEAPRTDKLKVSTSFANHEKDVVSFVDSLVFILYPFSGFEQPFYVLSEVSRPRRNFAKTTLVTMVGVGIVYFLVNIAFIGVVPKNEETQLYDLNIAAEFFRAIFDAEVAERVISGILSFSIFGNIVVMTFTASRVKQEIAKEGILPLSWWFSQSTATPVARLMARLKPTSAGAKDPKMREESPIGALCLHLVFSLLLVAITAGQTTTGAYDTLVSLYSYIFVVLVGFFVATGILFKRLKRGGKWVGGLGFRPWGGPTAAAIYAVTMAFLLIAAFLRPKAGSPFSKEQTGVEWFVAPTVAVGSLLLGALYYFGLEYVVPMWIHKHLEVDRTPRIEPDGDGGFVQPREEINVHWRHRHGLDEYGMG